MCASAAKVLAVRERGILSKRKRHQSEPGVGPDREIILSFVLKEIHDRASGLQVPQQVGHRLRFELDDLKLNPSLIEPDNRRRRSRYNSAPGVMDSNISADPVDSENMSAASKRKMFGSVSSPSVEDKEPFFCGDESLENSSTSYNQEECDPNEESNEDTKPAEVTHPSFNRQISDKGRKNREYFSMSSGIGSNPSSEGNSLEISRSSLESGFDSNYSRQTSKLSLGNNNQEDIPEEYTCRGDCSCKVQFPIGAVEGEMEYKEENFENSDSLNIEGMEDPAETSVIKTKLAEDGPSPTNTAPNSIMGDILEGPAPSIISNSPCVQTPENVLFSATNQENRKNTSPQLHITTDLSLKVSTEELPGHEFGLNQQKAEVSLPDFQMLLSPTEHSDEDMPVFPRSKLASTFPRKAPKRELDSLTSWEGPKKQCNRGGSIDYPKSQPIEFVVPENIQTASSSEILESFQPWIDPQAAFGKAFFKTHEERCELPNFIISNIIKEQSRKMGEDNEPPDKIINFIQKYTKSVDEHDESDGAKLEQEGMQGSGRMATSSQTGNGAAAMAESSPTESSEEAHQAEDSYHEDDVTLSPSDWERALVAARQCHRDKDSCSDHLCKLGRGALELLRDSLTNRERAEWQPSVKQLLRVLVEHGRLCDEMLCLSPWCTFFHKQSELETVVEYCSIFFNHCIGKLHKLLFIRNQRTLERPTHDNQLIQLADEVPDVVMGSPHLMPEEFITYSIIRFWDDFCVSNNYWAELIPAADSQTQYCNITRFPVNTLSALKALNKDHLSIIRHLWAIRSPTQLLVFQAYAGDSLRNHIMRQNPGGFQYPQLVHILERLLCGALYLRERNIVFLNWTSHAISMNADSVRLTDFSLATVLNDKAPMDMELVDDLVQIMRPYIIPPEMFDGLIGFGSEIWGLGAIAYEVATGHTIHDNLCHLPPEQARQQVSASPVPDLSLVESQNTNLKTFLDLCFKVPLKSRPRISVLLAFVRGLLDPNQSESLEVSPEKS